MLATAVETVHHIPVWHAIVLGITQGLSEFLPISSSGHLILVPWLFGWNEFTGPANTELNKTFDVALHIGTFVGAAAYFRSDLIRFAGGALRSIRRRAVEGDDERMAWLLLLSAIPGALVGALFASIIEEHLGQIWLIAVMLIVFGAVLLVADRAPRRRAFADFRARDALIMGICQAAALQPGVSRSSVTISAGRWLEFDRDSAARLSFLMSLPIIGGAGLYKGIEVAGSGGLPAGTEAAFFWGMVASAVTGALAVGLVLRVVRTHSFTPFVAYRAIVGLGVLVLVATGAR
ncbi:MAG TPA: undecaprenyl-diphosphate phosphatase [Acidimicrobiales bacterium]|nr:undecaprenyl-diphosphate phosphatase [Acidimicrobiales bacterium]